MEELGRPEVGEGDAVAGCGRRRSGKRDVECRWGADWELLFEVDRGGGCGAPATPVLEGREGDPEADEGGGPAAAEAVKRGGRGESPKGVNCGLEAGGCEKGGIVGGSCD